MKEKKTENFENGLGRLEDIVRQLESGEKGLEDSLLLFEEGVQLAQGLNKRLEDAKHRVEILIKEGGRLRAQPLKEDEHGQD